MLVNLVNIKEFILTRVQNESLLLRAIYRKRKDEVLAHFHLQTHVRRQRRADECRALVIINRQCECRYNTHRQRGEEERAASAGERFLGALAAVRDPLDV